MVIIRRRWDLTGDDGLLAPYWGPVVYQIVDWYAVLRHLDLSPGASPTWYTYPRA